MLRQDIQVIDPSNGDVSIAGIPDKEVEASREISIIVTKTAIDVIVEIKVMNNLRVGRLVIFPINLMNYTSPCIIINAR